MQEAYFEEENCATRENSYLDIERRNLAARAHIHAEIEVICVLAGEVEAVLAGEKRTLRSGEICIVMPWVPHSYARNHGMESLTHVMKLYSVKELQSCRISTPVIAPCDPHYTDFRMLIDTIASEATERNVGYLHAIAAQVSLFHMSILRYLSPEQISGKGAVEALRNNRFLEAFDRYLEAHYADPLTLDCAAAHMHYSRFYFAHRFTEITGQSFLEYITLFRLEKAQLLLKSGHSVLDTALQCGFGSTRSFHRAFHKHYGCAPSAMKL